MALMGIDEVGRGCWAGPLVVCGVRLEEGLLSGLRDSKKLSRLKREALCTDIKQEASAIALAWVHPEYIDAHGLSKAMKFACETVFSSLYNQGDSTIIDGNINFLANKEDITTMIKGDENIPAIAAASIIAKVARDSFMAAMDSRYEGYNFAAHVGYGTKAHMEALEANGICPLHRKSYKPIQKYVTK